MKHEKAIVRRGWKRTVCLCLAATCLLPSGKTRAQEPLGFTETEQPADMTSECGIVLSDAETDWTKLLSDGFVESCTPLTPQAVVQIDLPRAAAGLYLCWFCVPGEYKITVYDAKDAVIRSETAENGLVNAYYALPREAARVAVSCKTEALLSEITVFDAAYPLPDAVQRWKIGIEQTELLLITATPETAAKNHYALLAAMTAQQQTDVQLLVLDCPTRARQQELLDAVWALGIDRYPCFAGLRTTDQNDWATVCKDWGREETAAFLVAAIRRCKPLVVVTDSENDELAGAAQRFAAQQVKAACRAAETVTRYAESAQAYGVFSVQKLYLADRNGSTRLEPDAALAVFSGQTLREIVARADSYHAYASFYRLELTPDWAYRLESSAVGVDVDDGDLFSRVQRRQSVSLEPARRPLLAESAAQEPAKQDAATGVFDQSCFRAAYDPAEYVSFDHEHGYYEYRSDTLSVIIDRYERETGAGQALFLVAQICMRDVDAFHAAVQPNGETALPLQLARKSRAVLLMNADQAAANAGKKGILIQNGRILSEGTGADTLAFYPDMTLRIFSPGEIDAKSLLAQGVRNTVSLGPTLLRDGVKNTDATLAATGRDARAGIGMVDTGSLVVIVTDGRASKYSVGLRLDEFADLFEEFGCTQAYNLAGGRLTSLVFMGEQLTAAPRMIPNTGLRLRNALCWGYSEEVARVGEDASYDGDPRQ